MQRIQAGKIVHKGFDSVAGESAFLQELAARGLLDGFSGVHAAAWDLQGRTVGEEAVLPYKQYAPAVHGENAYAGAVVVNVKDFQDARKSCDDAAHALVRILVDDALLQNIGHPLVSRVAPASRICAMISPVQSESPCKNRREIA